MTYDEFIDDKAQLGGNHGFEPVWMPDFLFPFQRALVQWSLLKGRSAIFADCGLGKTPMQLVWAQNVAMKTVKPTLILTPLAVAGQTVRESAKFGIEAAQSRDGKIAAPICLANYERLHYFKPDDFGGVVCDESSILKNFDGVTRAAVTDFMRKIPYRLLCTATAAPNDYIELGTSSEAIGDLGYMDMLGRFFKANNGSLHPMHHTRAIQGDKWRFRGHAEHDFWRWVCSWARAVRKPSDLGFSDDDFALPPLETIQHIVTAQVKPEGFLFDMPAHTLQEQRNERRRSLTERCEKAASLIAPRNCSVAWCNLNDEGDLLEEIIPGAQQVSGTDSDDEKEEKFEAFARGDIRVMISKPSIAGLGLNWQHCAHQTFFPSHSFEQWYQAIRRSWRFGQKRPVHIDVITSEGEARVLANLQRKAAAAEEMFSQLVALMNDELSIKKTNRFTNQLQTPSWLS
jgi:hypothetical protein